MLDLNLLSFYQLFLSVIRMSDCVMYASLGVTPYEEHPPCIKLTTTNGCYLEICQGLIDFRYWLIIDGQSSYFGDLSDLMYELGFAVEVHAGDFSTWNPVDLTLEDVFAGIRKVDSLEPKQE